MRVGDWDAVLTLIDQANIPDTDKTANLRFLASSLGDYARGMRALDNNDVRNAEIASDHMDATLWRAQRDNEAKDEAKASADALKKKGTRQSSCDPYFA